MVFLVYPISTKKLVPDFTLFSRARYKESVGFILKNEFKTQQYFSKKQPNIIKFGKPKKKGNEKI